MREWTSATDIGKYNFTHWCDKPLTPYCHEVLFVPQTIADGWEAYCSCGEWKGFFSLYDVKGKDPQAETFAALQGAFDKHVATQQFGSEGK